MIRFLEPMLYIDAQAEKPVCLCEKCGGCRLRPLCKVCPAAARLETGDYNGVPEYLCRNAQELYRLLKREI